MKRNVQRRASDVKFVSLGYAKKRWKCHWSIDIIHWSDEVWQNDITEQRTLEPCGMNLWANAARSARTSWHVRHRISSVWVHFLSKHKTVMKEIAAEYKDDPQSGGRKRTQAIKSTLNRTKNHSSLRGEWLQGGWIHFLKWHQNAVDLNRSEQRERQNALRLTSQSSSSPAPRGQSWQGVRVVQRTHWHTDPGWIRPGRNRVDPWGPLRQNPVLLLSFALAGRLQRAWRQRDPTRVWNTAEHFSQLRKERLMYGPLLCSQESLQLLSQMMTYIHAHGRSWHFGGPNQKLKLGPLPKSSQN